MNWKAFRENLRVLSVRETNREAPGSVLLSSRQLQDNNGALKITDRFCSDQL